MLHGAFAARRTHQRALASAPCLCLRALAPAPSPTHRRHLYPPTHGPSPSQGLIFYRVAASDAALADGQSTLGAFTFVMLISYLLPFAAIPIFVYDKQFYLRESGLGLYPTWVHTISQACAPTPPRPTADITAATVAAPA